MQTLFDFNNLFMISLFSPSVEAMTGKPKWGLWKYYMFQRISDFSLEAALSYPDLSRLVLACDCKEGTWRHESYGPYKGNREKSAALDWDEVHEHLDDFKGAVMRFTPWKLLEVANAEADDIIAVLTQDHEASGKKTLINSADCDYLQLLSGLTAVYRPMKAEYAEFPFSVATAGTTVEYENCEEFVDIAVLTGQGCKDNVYNVKTPTDWDPWDEVKGKKKRKPPFGVKAAMKILDAAQAYDSKDEGIKTELIKLGEKAKVGDLYYENYQRNKKLIDFKEIPEDVRFSIMDKYQTVCARPEICDFAGLVNYYHWNSMLDMAEDLDEMWGLICEQNATKEKEEKEEKANA